MQHRHSLTVLLSAAMASSAAAGAADDHRTYELSPAEKAAGWTVLFDGTTTDHFRGFKHHAFPTRGWIIEDGTLRVVARGGGGDIITREKYTNFDLILEFKVSQRANSGIMYRVTEEHDTTWQTGPEYQILDDAGHNIASDSKQSTGALYDLAAPSEGKSVKAAGEWNEARIRLKDGKVQHWLNGALLLEEDLDSDDFKSRVAGSKFRAYEGFGIRKSGHIALQDHGDDVWFRNIRIRDLDAPLPGQVNLFMKDGEFHNATGFFNDGTLDDAFYLDGDLLITRGRPFGYIRTTDDYDNFVLKLQWRFNPETRTEGNGGVLVRMVGEDQVWPRSVEAQLHSKNAGDFWNIGEFEMQTDPERTRGRNTRKTHLAEYSVGEWNEYEIIVDRGDIILFINGQEVNRAWDVEEIAGKICLQSEGVEMHFRNIRLAPIRYDE